MDMSIDLLDEHEVAKLLKCSERKLRHFRQAGGGPHYLKVGGSVRYPRQDLEKWLGGDTPYTGNGNVAMPLDIFSFRAEMMRLRFIERGDLHGFSDEEWAAFKENPWYFFCSCETPQRTALWEAMERDRRNYLRDERRMPHRD